MLSDDQLRAAFQAQRPERQQIVDIRARVRAQTWKRRIQRPLEAALSLFALAVFALSLSRGQGGPQLWVLLPFFAVFIPMIWWLVLRPARDKACYASGAVQDYARLRLNQLRENLREAWLARQATRALLLYSVIVVLLTGWLGAAEWRLAGATLLIWSLLWALGCWAVLRWYRPRQLREYRALRRLLPRSDQAMD